jgi:glutaredoxin
MMMRLRLVVVVTVLILMISCLSYAVRAESAGHTAPVVVEAASNVELYITDWCPYCAQAMKFLKANGIPYVAYDIEKDRAAADRKRKLSARSGVPLAVINGKKIFGFSEEAYSRALGLKK